MVLTSAGKLVVVVLCMAFILVTTHLNVGTAVFGERYVEGMTDQTFDDTIKIEYFYHVNKEKKTGYKPLSQIDGGLFLPYEKILQPDGTETTKKMRVARLRSMTKKEVFTKEEAEEKKFELYGENGARIPFTSLFREKLTGLGYHTIPVQYSKTEGWSDEYLPLSEVTDGNHFVRISATIPKGSESIHVDTFEQSRNLLRIHKEHCNLIHLSLYDKEKNKIPYVDLFEKTKKEEPEPTKPVPNDTGSKQSDVKPAPQYPNNQAPQPYVSDATSNTRTTQLPPMADRQSQDIAQQIMNVNAIKQV